MIPNASLLRRHQWHWAATLWCGIPEIVDDGHSCSCKYAWISSLLQLHWKRSIFVCKISHPYFWCIRHKDDQHYPRCWLWIFNPCYIVSRKDVSTVIVILDQSLRRNTSQINGEDQWLPCFGDLVQKAMNHDLSISVVFAQNFHRSLSNGWKCQHNVQELRRVDGVSGCAYFLQM